MPRFESKETDLYIDGKKVSRGWESFSGWYWFATEEADKQDSIIDGKVYKNDTIWFGLVQGLEEEWGYFSQAEIESLKPAHGKSKSKICHMQAEEDDFV